MRRIVLALSLLPGLAWGADGDCLVIKGDLLIMAGHPWCIPMLPGQVATAPEISPTQGTFATDDQAAHRDFVVGGKNGTKLSVPIFEDGFADIAHTTCEGSQCPAFVLSRDDREKLDIFHKANALHACVRGADGSIFCPAQ